MVGNNIVATNSNNSTGNPIKVFLFGNIPVTFSARNNFIIPPSPIGYKGRTMIAEQNYRTTSRPLGFESILLTPLLDLYFELGDLVGKRDDAYQERPPCHT